MKKLLLQSLCAAFLLGVAHPAPGQSGNASPTALKSLPAPEDMLEQAAMNLEEIRDVLENILAKAEQARREQNADKMDCVKSVLTSTKGLIELADDAIVLLEEALTSKIPRAAAYEFTKIAIAKREVLLKGEEANQCMIDRIATATPVSLPPEITETEPLVPVPDADNSQLNLAILGMRDLDIDYIRLNLLAEQAQLSESSINLQCVLEKRAEADALVRMAGRAKRIIENAPPGTPSSQQIRELNKIEVVRQAIRIKIAEAEACAGAPN